MNFKQFNRSIIALLISVFSISSSHAFPFTQVSIDPLELQIQFSSRQLTYTGQNSVLRCKAETLDIEPTIRTDELPLQVTVDTYPTSRNAFTKSLRISVLKSETLQNRFVFPYSKQQCSALIQLFFENAKTGEELVASITENGEFFSPNVTSDIKSKYNGITLIIETVLAGNMGDDPSRPLCKDMLFAKKNDGSAPFKIGNEPSYRDCR